VADNKHLLSEHVRLLRRRGHPPILRRRRWRSRAPGLGPPRDRVRIGTRDQTTIWCPRALNILPTRQTRRAERRIRAHPSTQGSDPYRPSAVDLANSIPYQWGRQRRPHEFARRSAGAKQVARPRSRKRGLVTRTQPEPTAG
jgi:hypothetical protein